MVEMDTFHCLVLVLLLYINFCLQSVESEQGCWYKCEKNKKCVYHSKEGRKVCVLKRCLKPKSHGFCRRYTQRYYFDHKTFECKCFKYGGCYGSRNNFLTKLSCESRCFPPPFDTPDGYVTTLPDFTPSTAEPQIQTITGTTTPITAPSTPTNTTAATTQLVLTTNTATAPINTTLPETTAPTASITANNVTGEGNSTSLTTAAITLTLDVLSTIASTSETGSVPQTSITELATPITTIVPTAPTTNIVISTTLLHACNNVTPVAGLTFFPPGGANITEKKAYRCTEQNQTFDVYSFYYLMTYACPIIICQPGGTYSPLPTNLCTVSPNLPPGDSTLTIPGTITSPGFDGITKYPSGAALYRWNIVTTAQIIAIQITILDLPNIISYCPRIQGDVIEIYCGFSTLHPHYKFCNSMRPPATIFCANSCIVIILSLNSDTDTGLGFSLAWSILVQ